MDPQPTPYTCPGCGSSEMVILPNSDRVTCEDCERTYSEAELVAWRTTGVRPDPIAEPTEQ